MYLYQLMDTFGEILRTETHANPREFTNDTPIWHMYYVAFSFSLRSIPDPAPLFSVEQFGLASAAFVWMQWRNLLSPPTSKVACVAILSLVTTSIVNFKQVTSSSADKRASSLRPRN